MCVSMDEKNFSTKKSTDESEVIDFYNQYAEKWDNRFGKASSDRVFFEERWASFEDLLPSSKEKLKALELGVGTGVYIDKTSRIFESIVAVDGSVNMLNELEYKLKNLRISNVTILNKNVISIPELPSNSFDVVYFFGLIEHIIDIKSFSEEIYRVLRKGGVVIGVTPNANSPWYKIRSFFRGTGKHCSSDTYYTEDSLKTVFSENNFSLDKIKYWGAVPAGLNNKVIIWILNLLGRILVVTPAAKYLGGITFRFEKV